MPLSQSENHIGSGGGGGGGARLYHASLGSRKTNSEGWPPMAGGPNVGK